MHNTAPTAFLGHVLKNIFPTFLQGLGAVSEYLPSTNFVRGAILGSEIHQ